MNQQHYSMVIQWDDEEAIKNALEVIDLWVEVARQDGRPIPPPQKYAA